MSRFTQFKKPVAETFLSAIDWAKIGFVVGTVVTLAIAVGQIGALGLSNASRLNWAAWVKGPFFGALLGAGALIAVFLTGVLLGFLHTFIKGWFGQRGLIWSIRVAIVLLALIGLFYIARLQQNSVAARYPGLAKQPDAKTTAGAIARQERALGQLSTAAANMIDSLSRTESELGETRRQLAQSLAEMDRQKTAVGRAGATLASLTEQQRQIEMQMSELQRVLGGARPLTRSDLQASQTTSVWQGFLLGVISSVLASYIFSWLSRRRTAA